MAGFDRRRKSSILHLGATGLGGRQTQFGANRPTECYDARKYISGMVCHMVKILTNEEIKNALSQVSVVNEGKASPDRASYGALSANDFELLLYALYQHRQGPDVGYDSVRLMITGADQGRDLWLTQDELPVGLVQCKRVEQGFSAPAAIREVIKFLLFAELDPKLLPDPSKFCFSLAVSADPAGTTTSLF
jgi:hypothetical protein